MLQHSGCNVKNVFKDQVNQTLDVLSIKQVSKETNTMRRDLNTKTPVFWRTVNYNSDSVTEIVKEKAVAHII